MWLSPFINRYLDSNDLINSKTKLNTIFIGFDNPITIGAI